MARRQILHRVRLGELMHHWHSSSRDPIYAVGSFYFANQRYPDPEIVDRALDELEEDYENSKIPGNRGGWGPSETKELSIILRNLRHYRDIDYSHV